MLCASADAVACTEKTVTVETRVEAGTVRVVETEMMVVVTK